MQILYYFHVAIAIFVIVITDIEVGKELNFGKVNDIQKAPPKLSDASNLL